MALIIFLSIYIIGVIFSFFYGRKCERRFMKSLGLPYKWYDAKTNLIFSIGSWITVCARYVAERTYFNQAKDKSNPPNWL